MQSSALPLSESPPAVPAAPATLAAPGALGPSAPEACPHAEFPPPVPGGGGLPGALWGPEGRPSPKAEAKAEAKQEGEVVLLTAEEKAKKEEELLAATAAAWGMLAPPAPLHLPLPLHLPPLAGAPKREDDLALPTLAIVDLPPPAAARPLGIGEIPHNYLTEASRMELLDQCVKRNSRSSVGVRKELMHSVAKSFVSGAIEGLFETHLHIAIYEEIRNSNRRTGRRRRRHAKSSLKKARREYIRKPPSGPARFDAPREA